MADFERIQDFRQGDGEVPLMLARLYHHLQQPDKACEALEEHVLKFPLSIAATHINILAELYMESKDYQKAADLIQKNMHLVTTESEPLIDLQVRKPHSFNTNLRSLFNVMKSHCKVTPRLTWFHQFEGIFWPICMRLFDSTSKTKRLYKLEQIDPSSAISSHNCVSDLCRCQK